MGKKRNDPQRSASRREFLRNALVGSAGVALATTGGEAKAAPAVAADAATGSKAGTAGYRETDHIRAYYETAGR